MGLSKKLHLERALELNKTLKSSQKVAKQLCQEFNCEFKETESRKIRDWLSSQEKSNPSPKPIESEMFKEAQKRKVNKDSKYYLITSAQNATPVNKELLRNMEAYAEFLGGIIEVIPLRYRNPTTAGEGGKDDYWHKDVETYLIANKHSLNKRLTVLANVKTQPTASMPLSGMEGLTGSESSVIGHPRQHMITLPVLEGYPKKVMLSTGSVTIPNASDSKAGAKAVFNHTYGFVIVEILDDTTFYIRHVSAQSNGTFYDLDYRVENGVVQGAIDSVDAIVLGDLHLGKHDDSALQASYEMLERFNPRNVILHDLCDSTSISHHEAGNPFSQLKKERDGSNSVEKEIALSLGFLDSVLKYNPVVVTSNHDGHLDKWLNTVDWRKEPGNKYTYLTYAKLKADGEMPNGILAYEVNKKFGNRVKCLDENTSFKVRGVELSQHGHKGASGSKGSPGQFKRLSTRIVTAHSHSPRKEDGWNCVGTLTSYRIGYNQGLSAWLHSNIIIHKNGKIQNLLIIKGEYSTI